MFDHDIERALKNGKLAQKEREKKLVADLKKKKLNKKIALGTAAVLGTAGLAYAGKKLYDKKKKKEKE